MTSLLRYANGGHQTTGLLTADKPFLLKLLFHSTLVNYCLLTLIYLTGEVHFIDTSISSTNDLDIESYFLILELNFKWRKSDISPVLLLRFLFDEMDVSMKRTRSIFNYSCIYFVFLVMFVLVRSRIMIYVIYERNLKSVTCMYRYVKECLLHVHTFSFSLIRNEVELAYVTILYSFSKKCARNSIAAIDRWRIYFSS